MESTQKFKGTKKQPREYDNQLTDTCSESLAKGYKPKTTKNNRRTYLVSKENQQQEIGLLLEWI